MTSKQRKAILDAAQEIFQVVNSIQDGAMDDVSNLMPTLDNIAHDLEDLANE